ncbi:MAG: DUF1800 family protein [Ilumatobacter sp.]|nr:DUF1800 family protein [Ilumatobacter sp.]
MPVLDDIEHLLRRTEFVARPARVAQLTPLSLEAAVDDILAVPANPGTAALTETQNWRRGEQLTHFWLDRMAHDSPRPIQEKMAFFWHGHFCSEFGKVGSADLMQEQIDGFRFGALSNLRTLATNMSTQVAMLRYLDNNRNRDTSPNQNFARELMELFLLGVGNYLEADVEAATAAWTGHTDDWQTDEYVWRDDWHDGSAKQFLGRTINTDNSSQAARRLHGAETIDVMLGSGVVPNTVPNVPNRGRDAREVAAEFLSKKLWIEFAGTQPSAPVLAALRDAALAADFAITPWLRALLLRDEFYSAEVKQGLVRSPVEFTVALMVATGRRSAEATPLWLMQGMGQRPLFPPNVSGWKHNAYWVNASAMAKRTETVRSFVWRSMRGYWGDEDPYLHLAGGSINREVVQDRDSTGRAVLDQLLVLMGLSLTPTSYDALAAFADAAQRWERIDLAHLILFSPELQVA